MFKFQNAFWEIESEDSNEAICCQVVDGRATNRRAYFSLNVIRNAPAVTIGDTYW